MINHKGLTLIELVFSMMIVAVVFTVVPKIIFASNKSMQLSKKEDALYNAYSLMGSILRLPWDENTIASGGKILLDCNNDGYRVGGFIGSRNCIDSTYTSSTIGHDTSDNSDFNDIDDYDSQIIKVNQSDKNIYDVEVSVNYANDNKLKEINTTVTSGDDNTKMDGFQSSFTYFSVDLGHIQIKRREWDQ